MQAGSSHYVQGQEAEGQQDVGLSYKTSRPTFQWASSSKALPSEGSMIFPNSSTNWDQVSLGDIFHPNHKSGPVMAVGT